MQFFHLALATLFSFSAFVLAEAKPSPQGVYDIIAPPEPAPAGCKKSHPNRLALTFRVIEWGLPLVGPLGRVCDRATQLSMTLRNGILNDRQGRIGSVVANRQIQFDGPPAQAGAIYTAGWSLCNDQTMALGNQKVFFRCKSGEIYNLYDRTLGSHCQSVYFHMVEVEGSCTK